MNCEPAYKCSTLAVLAERLEPLTPGWGHNVGRDEATRTGKKPRQYTWYFDRGDEAASYEPSSERVDLTANTVTAVMVASLDIQAETIEEIETGFARLVYAIKSTAERGGYIDARILSARVGDHDMGARVHFWTARVVYRVLLRAQDPNPGQAETVAVNGQLIDPSGDLVGEIEAG